MTPNPTTTPSASMTMASNTASTVSTGGDDLDAGAVVCTCWPSSRKQRKQRSNQHAPVRRRTMYHETADGLRCLPSWIGDSDLDEFEDAEEYQVDVAPNGKMTGATSKRQSNFSVDGSTMFFDTVQEEEDGMASTDQRDKVSQYQRNAPDKSNSNTDADQHEDIYPIVTTTYLKPKPRVSMLEPRTMLLEHALELQQLADDDTGDENAATVNSGMHETAIAAEGRSPTKGDPHNRRLKHKKSMRRMSRSLSNLFHGVRSNGKLQSKRNQRSTTEGLIHPDVVVPDKGFPGRLTKEELEQAQLLMKELQKPENQTLADMVYMFSEIEEEPFALCRFLRANKFVAADTLQRLRGESSSWEKARANDMYPQVEIALDCPKSLFLSQYPVKYIGQAKNGCPVSYLRAGRIQPEGLLCVTTIEKASNFFWHQSYHAFIHAMKRSQKIHPNVCRMEVVVVLDLDGISASTLASPDAMECVKLAGSVGDSFPETLHCLIVLNAPSYFSVSWRIIKRLIDPRTAQRIQVFSSQTKAFQRLHELIDLEHLPSDYAGLNTSLDDAFGDCDDDADPAKEIVGESNVDGTDTKISVNNTNTTIDELTPLNTRTQKQRIDTQLLSLKRQKTVKHIVKCKTGETLRSIRIHTRSSSSAKFHARTKSGTLLCDSVKVRGAQHNDGSTMTCSGGIELPLDTTAIATAEIEVVGEDQNDTPARFRDASRGWFLVEATLTRSV